MLRDFNIFIMIALIMLPLKSWAGVALPEDKSSAIILAYHRIGEDANPDSNLRIAQFREHITEIINGDYNVLPLSDIITAIKTGQALPPRTLAITLEGGYRSAYENAIPHLLGNNIPFTLFFASGSLDHQNHIGWRELKALSRKNGVSLGILPASYARITHLPLAEQARQINVARSAFRTNIGQEAPYFAYPFGETSTALKNILRSQGFDAAFSLQSGAAHSGSDLLELPRFTMTEGFGDIDRLRLVTNTLPLPANDIEPSNSLITSETPHIGFTVPQALEKSLETLSCFISGQPKPSIEILGKRVEIRAAEPIVNQRTRVNCTMAGTQDENDKTRARWLGMLLHKSL